MIQRHYEQDLPVHYYKSKTSKITCTIFWDWFKNHFCSEVIALYGHYQKVHLILDNSIVGQFHDKGTEDVNPHFSDLNAICCMGLLRSEKLLSKIAALYDQ